MLFIILLECSIELVPSELTALKPIQKHAGRRKKKPTELLLDQSYHGMVMPRLEEHERRGRPDIVFLSLHTLLETPLCKQGGLQLYLHLRDGRIVYVNSQVRIPRNQERFVGLLEQLLVVGRVPPHGDSLLEVTDHTLPSLISDLEAKHSRVKSFIAVEDGESTTFDGLVELYPSDPKEHVVFGVGAFPHGDFSPSVIQLFEKKLCLDVDVMMAWHVCAEILWSYSKKHTVTKNRHATE
ncbi:MAG: Ribosomal RNA small subunit methyltransferase Nep1 [Candidatus Thorarchaeota archaeon]|nr:MAG: Ribosomal RNA small subunit methyltransferase Nep1 [Candidatus Thorarchaeota archaeon]